MRLVVRLIWIVLIVSACGHSDAAPDASSPAPDAPADGAATAIGQACTAATPLEQGTCPAGEQCATDALGFPGGVCTMRCETATCPAGSVCEAIGDGLYCGVPCTSDADCRTPDYRCQPAPADTTLAVCLPTTFYGDPMPGTNNGHACASPLMTPP